MARVLELLDYNRHDLDLRRAPQAPPIPVRTRRPPGRSRFETLASLSSRPSLEFGQTLNVLLAAVRLGKNPGPEVLQPIWTEEAMHRSCAMMRLLDARGRRTGNPAAVRMEQSLAQDLATLFRSLDACSADERVPCSSLLRDVVTDLVALFGPGASTDDVTLWTNIQRLLLPAYKRRALVLATTELVINALQHAFHGRPCGRIEVSLTSLGPARAWLQVKDDGAGFACGRPNLHCGVAAGLADLLEADLAYFRTRTQTIAEVIFPVGATR